MDFANEPHVRLYVHDSTTWKRLGWDGQVVLEQLLRRAYPLGTIELGNGVEPWEAVVMHCGAPEDVARRGTSRCLELGCIVHEANRLVFPRYADAQDCAKSGAQRVREHRERERLRQVSLKRNVTSSSNESLPDVTPGNGVKQAVTDGNGAHGSNGHAPVASLAAKGRFWLAEVLGRDDHDHRGKWEHAFEEMAQKPEQEKRDVARSIRQVIDKPGKRQILKPQHILDYWRDYADGQPPGSWKRDNGPPPGAAEVAAAKQAFDAARAKYRAATDAETKARLMAVWSEADAILKATKARFQWTG